MAAPTLPSIASGVTPAPPSAVPALNAIVFTDATHGWAAGQGAILATADGGRTWQRQYGGSLDITALDFTGEAHGWAVGDKGGMRTTDGGWSWTELP